MKHKSFIKHLLSACFCVALALVCILGIAGKAQAATVNDLEYSILDGEVTITSCNQNASGKLNIPKKIKGYPVTRIGDSAFYGCKSLTSITIPDSVTSIEDRAFRGCTSLKTVTIPDSVSHIGSDAFFSCSNLQYKIYDNAKYLGNSENPYFALVDITSVYIKSCRIHSKTKVLADEAFTQGYYLKTVTIPKGITSISDNLFYDCYALTSVNIPDGVTSIEDGAFYGCENLKSVTIPDSVISIGDGAFSGCDGLKSVTIPDSVISIGDDAFYGCGNLKSVTIPDSVTSIGKEAFRYCSSLTSVTIGDSVTSIGESVFSGCTSLKTVTIGDSVTSIGEGAFEDCTSLTSVTIPDSVTSIYFWAFRGCTSLKTVTIPDSVASIGGSAFEDCTSLTSVTIPDSVHTIESDVFGGCSSLKTIFIPEQIWIIDYRAFSGCTSLSTIIFEGNAPSFSSNTFSKVTATAYYSREDETWTKSVMQNYGGKITWKKLVSTVITQPKTAYAANGGKVSTTVKAIGDGLTYQWYFKNAGDSKYTKSSITTATYSCKMNSSNNGRYVRCKITDKYGNSVWTKTVRLWMKASITTQPTNKIVNDGASVKMAIKAAGNDLKYQWQYRTSSSGSWKNVSAASGKTANYWITATVSKNGYQYRCKVSDSADNVVYTKVVNLYVLGIKTQPVNKTVVAGKTTKLTVTATGKGLTYQWQYRTSSSDSWKNASATGNKTKTLSVAATLAKHGYQYRCKITDSTGNTVKTKIVTLYVLGIKTQPANKSVTAGTFTKFTVKAIGKGLVYQWQYKTSTSGSWNNVSASTGKTATYGLTAAARHNGYQYRCKITDSAGNVIYTSIVKLTVK